MLKEHEEIIEKLCDRIGLPKDNLEDKSPFYVIELFNKMNEVNKHAS